MKKFDEKILMRAFVLVDSKIKKSTMNTDLNNREDLEQEIKLKVIEAILKGKIETPLTFTEYKEKFDRRKAVS
ncbi:hypothetical protein ACFVAD_20375 [Sutcliffiella sp. NPDC057660]|uniref:hypothetical protein n=1 Tax=Sutcliffiella sp. NPDC057660 TaxID=3346199 RepID=UPI0036760F01